MDDRERLELFHKRRMFHLIMWGMFRTNRRRNLERDASVCRSFDGEVSSFQGSPVCKLDETGREHIKEVLQYEMNGNPTMVARMDNDDKLFISPISLNKWRQEEDVEKKCSRKMCIFSSDF